MTNLKILTLALLAMAVLVFAAPRANATTISVTEGGNIFTIDYTVSGSTLSITGWDLNGHKDDGKLFVVGAIGTNVTVVGNTSFDTSTKKGEGPFKGMFGVKDPGGDSSLPLGTFTLGGTPNTLVFHLGGFTSSSCSIWIEGPIGGGNGASNGSLGTCDGSTQPPTVPEPGTLGLLGTGLVGIAAVVRRRFAK